MWEHAFVSDDHTTEVAVRPSSATVRLFHGLGGVELGVRHTGRKALVFVKFRKLVIAGWWKAPSVAPGLGRSQARPLGLHRDRELCHHVLRVIHLSE